VHAFARLTIDGQSIYISGQGDSPTVTVTVTSANPAPSPTADPPAALQNPNTVPGCTDWPATKYLQTPLVNGSAAVGGNAYNQGDHTLCDSTSFINQYYAIDVEVPDGTQLRAPGGAGKVLWAGPAPGGWASCGNEVVMDYGDGYWSVQCHLGAIYVHTGQTTSNDTVIALSDNSGLNPATGQPWGPHLHFALFKGASMTTDGGVHGGQSAKAHHMRYFAGGGGYYEDLDYNDFPNGLTISN
jgi:murein DD-endopeptidase MepM/ murein hydrolase activator NlpD